MSDRQAFMNAIIADIDNDLPRLVFADWLDDHGEPDRAEFIRVQCELASLPADAPNREELAAREAELLTRYGYEWAEEYGQEIDNFIYRRGFIEQAAFSLERTSREILSLLSRIPIRHIREDGQFCDLNGFIDALYRLPPNRLTGLEFWGLYAFDDGLLREMVLAPSLGSLRTLILHHDRNGNMAEDSVIVDALMSPLRHHVETLGVNIDGMWRGPSAAVMEAMAASPHLRNLRTLLAPGLGDPGHDSQDTPELLARFGRSPNFANLSVVDLRGLNFIDDSWEAVLAWPFFPKLERVWLNGGCLRIPPDNHGGGLSELPEWRALFDRACPNVDWETEFVDPWNYNPWLNGLSWGERKQEPLFAMCRFLQTADFDGLEVEYRAKCLQVAGPDTTREIDELPFDDFGRELERSYRRSLAVTPIGGAVYLRIRTNQQDWQAAFHSYDADLRDSDVPEYEGGYSVAPREFQGPTFPTAGESFGKHIGDGLRPDRPRLYLVARLVAAFGRVVRRNPVPVSIYFSNNSFLCRIIKPQR